MPKLACRWCVGTIRRNAMNVSFVMGHKRGTCCRCLRARAHGASSTEKQIDGEYRKNIPCQLAHIARKKKRLTRCPTRRSSLESVARVSHAPGRDDRGGLRQRPPSAVGEGCCRARPISLAATFAQMHTPAAAFPVAALWMCTTTYHQLYP